MQRVGLLGYGEIGQALHKVYQESGLSCEVLVKDIVRDDGLHDLDVLNVAIPFNDSFDFVEAVVKVAKSSSSKMVIIHSTVSVGTTRSLKEKLGLTVKVAHSPCRGVHPNLFEGIMTFVKFIGAPLRDDAPAVESHLHSLGISTHICKSSETSELAKLLDTSYYGICIAYHGEAQRACQQFDADFEDVMTVYNQTYNTGYTILKKPNVVRPVLTPPQGGIGGHCVVQNADLLKKQFESPALDFITMYRKSDK